MSNGRGRSRAGVYVAMAAVALTVGIGAVGSAGASGADDQVVHADNGTVFMPETVNIQPGERVTWTFDNPTIPHNVVEKEDSPNDWTTGPAGAAIEVDKPDVGPIQFAAAGTYTFECQVHNGMDGTVIVGGGGTPDPDPDPSPSPSPSATPTPTPGGGGSTTTPPPSPTPDTVKPTVGSLKLTAARRAVRVRFRLSEPATVTIKVRRRGSKRVLKSARLQAPAGTRAVTLRSKKLRRGRYTVEIQARDASGNRSTVARRSLTLRR